VGVAIPQRVHTSSFSTVGSIRSVPLHTSPAGRTRAVAPHSTAFAPNSSQSGVNWVPILLAVAGGAATIGLIVAVIAMAKKAKDAKKKAEKQTIECKRQYEAAATCCSAAMSKSLTVDQDVSSAW